MQFCIFQVHEENGMKWDREDFCPTNPDLADILGDMDLDFEDFRFFHLFKTTDFQVSDFQIFRVCAKMKTLIPSKLNSHDFFLAFFRFHLEKLTSPDQKRIKTSPGLLFHARFFFHGNSPKPNFWVALFGRKTCAGGASGGIPTPPPITV